MYLLHEAGHAFTTRSSDEREEWHACSVRIAPYIAATADPFHASTSAHRRLYAQKHRTRISPKRLPLARSFVEKQDDSTRQARCQTQYSTAHARMDLNSQRLCPHARRPARIEPTGARLHAHRASARRRPALVRRDPQLFETPGPGPGASAVPSRETAHLINEVSTDRR